MSRTIQKIVDPLRIPLDIHRKKMNMPLRCIMLPLCPHTKNCLILQRTIWMPSIDGSHHQRIQHMLLRVHHLHPHTPQRLPYCHNRLPYITLSQHLPDHLLTFRLPHTTHGQSVLLQLRDRYFLDSVLIRPLQRHALPIAHHRSCQKVLSEKEPKH